MRDVGSGGVMGARTWARRMGVAAIVVVVAGAATWGALELTSGSGESSVRGVADGGSTSTGASSTTVAANPKAVTGLVLDVTRSYGNRYADGLLPVGDQQYSTTTAAKGTPYLCRAMTGGGGAATRGPWFVNNNTQYDLAKKPAVQGSVSWPGTYSEQVNGSSRVIVTNDLPHDHTTGQFPVASSDPAYQYDRNPNTIRAQSFTYTLPSSPEVLSSPSCMGGEVGVMTTGVALFNAFDAGGRDAGAWEVQDGCSGHPQMSGQYHYHTLSSCITDTSVSTVIGWALDGFPITGPKVGANNVLTTSDLDECHGITSTVVVNGAKVTTYHYVMTQDFPYSVSCFRGTPTQVAR